MSAVGRRIDRYVVEAELDAGGFGTVYRARHTVIGRTVALKLLHASRSASLAVVERFLREARIVAALSSPHVVQVLDAGMTDDRELFLAMELLQGDSLAQRLARTGPMPVRDALAIARQILAGLAAAHAAGVVHRDLKPANVFLARTPDHREIAKVLDFGISKSRSGGEGDVITMTGAVLGTPHYMAPEQLQGARDVDGRADLYALAVVLYEMLSGRLPYEAETLEHLIAKRISDPPMLLGSVAPHLPREVIAVVERGLSRDPDARFRTAQEFDAALGQLLARLESVHMPPTSTPQRVVVSPTGRPPSPSMALGMTHATPGGGSATGPVASGAVMMRSPIARPAAATPSGTVSSGSMPSGTVSGLPPGTTRLPTRGISIGLLAIALAGAALVILVLSAALASVTTAWVMTRGPDTTAPAPASAPTPTPTSAPTPIPIPTPTSIPTTPAERGPLRVTVDTVLGGVGQATLEDLIDRATPSIDRCRRGVDDDVRVQLLTGAPGTGQIAIAQPDPNAPHGDDTTARCVARALQGAAPLSDRDSDGIIVIVAHLPAR